MAVDFTPTMEEYSGQGKFRYWVQMVLPTIYDDSLSYMELLNKVVYVINLAIEDVNTVEENVAALLTAFEQLQQYTNDYFDNLDVQEEINKKLDEMVSDGTFATVLQPLIQNYQEQLDVLVARIDNLASTITPGSTSGDAEIIDARVGFNGVTYTNLGEAIRTQVGDLSEDVRDYFEYTEAPGYYTDNGGIHEPSSYWQEKYTSNKFDVSQYENVRVIVRTDVTIDQWVAYLFYDENETLIGQRRTLGAEYTQVFEGNIEIPENVHYLALTYRTHGVTNSLTCYGYYNAKDISKFSGKFSQIDVNRENITDIYSYIKEDFNYTESPGYYAWNGTISPQTNYYKEVYTNKFNVGGFEKVFISVTLDVAIDQWIAYLFYDENETLIGQRQTLAEGHTVTLERTLDIPENAYYIALTYRTHGVSNGLTCYGYYNVDAIKNIARRLKSYDVIGNNRINTAYNPYRFNGLYDHMFVDIINNTITIPHQSLYHVKLSRLFGFNSIEVNVNKTSDGVYWVNHLVGGKFGPYFSHVDGATDISNTNASTVTWEWIETNVRYNSIFPKLRTRPPKLDEFIGECKQQNLIPFVTATEAGMIEIVERIMGKGNYIAYNATRAIAPTAIIYQWNSSLSTKEAILNYCKQFGAPFIFGMSNPLRFTDEELKDIINELHSNGFMIGTSYADREWSKYHYLGFDVIGTQRQIPRIEAPTICSYHTLNNYDNFNYTNASVNNDGYLEFTADGTLEPIIDNTQYLFAGVDLEIEFEGTLTVNPIGEYPSNTITNDGTMPYIITTLVINGVPKVTINCTSGCIIKNINYKATEF